ncbi:MAG: TolC family outer membrane protein [Betaproteobacteria bacterium]|nr:TolC family outer membrane protein [Betaproteobacteria bacterium]
MKSTFRLSNSALAVALALGFAGLAHAQSLKDAVQQTVSSNPDVRYDATQRLANDQAVNVARGGYLPKVDLFAGYGREGSDNLVTRTYFANQTPPQQTNQYRTLTRREAQATLSQMLFDGMGVYSEVNRNKARVESAAYKTLGTSEIFGLRAIEVYLNVLRTREIVELTKQNLDFHLKTQDQIKVRSGGGVGRKSDQEQIDARVALAKANLGAAEANLRDAEIQFQRIVGGRPTSLVKPVLPEPSALPKNEEEAVKVAIENHPILKSAQADVKATEYQQKAAESFMFPRFDAEFGYGKNDNLDGQPGPNDERYAMVRMRWNIFKGLSDVSRVKETGYFKVQAMEVRNRTQRQVDEAARLSWNALVSVRERLPSLRDHAVKSQETRDSYAQQFNLGQRTLLDLLDSENEVYTARTDYLTGEYLEAFARYRLLADTNLLLTNLGVTPPEESVLTAD